MHKIIKNILFLVFVSYSIANIDYNTEIQPILNIYCIDCHGNMGGLNLTSYENIMEGGLSGDVIVPYNHLLSELWIRVSSGQMPPGNNDLISYEVNLISQWINEGALQTPDCDSSLECESVLTCCDGMLYPSNCCEENCDDAIDLCQDILLGDIEIKTLASEYFAPLSIAESIAISRCSNM